MEAQCTLLSLQRQIAKTRESYKLQVDADGVAVRVSTLIHMTGLLEWATAFDSSQLTQQSTLILSTGPWRDDNLLAAQWSPFCREKHTNRLLCVCGDCVMIREAVVSRVPCSPFVTPYWR